MNSKYLYGTHGTCRTYADIIIRNKKFNLGHGRHGFGVYLWQSHSPDDWTYAQALAQAYAKGQQKRFESENDPSVCVLKCTLSVDENRFYDLVCHEHHGLFSSYLTKLCNKCGREVLNKYSWTRVYAAFFDMVKQMRKDEGIEEDIDVYYVLAEVTYVEKHAILYVTTNKSAGCYVVRNNNVFKKIER